MNRFLIVMAAASAMSTTLMAQSEPRPLETPQIECHRVFEEARRLPSPSPRSVYDYGSRVADQGGRCLRSGINDVRSSGGQGGGNGRGGRAE